MFQLTVTGSQLAAALAAKGKYNSISLSRDPKELFCFLGIVLAGFAKGAALGTLANSLNSAASDETTYAQRFYRTLPRTTLHH